MKHIATTLAALILGALLLVPPSARADRVRLRADVDRSVLRADEKQRAYLHLEVEGFDLRGARARAPLNVAIVIDKSSSMAGRKIQQAKAAALEALSQLGDDDIVSIVAYDSTVSVLVPATKVRDRHTIRHGIQRLRAGGMTALFGGTAKGADEVRKFLGEERVNRVILVSDGQANVGPSTPGQLGALGRSLRSEGISVTTVGLGLDYNEDLMVAIAERSGGQHVFVEHESELARIFRKGFGSLAAICAKDVVVSIEVAEGFRPVRLLGIEGDIVGQTITVRLEALYSGQADIVVLELETRPLPESSRPVAGVSVRYRNLDTQQMDEVLENVAVRFSTRPGDVEASVNKRVMTHVVELIATERNEAALKLRDEGRVDDARKALRANAVYLDQNYKSLGSESLRGLSADNDGDAQSLAPDQWKQRRKAIRSRNFKAKLRSGDF